MLQLPEIAGRNFTRPSAKKGKRSSTRQRRPKTAASRLDGLVKNFREARRKALSADRAYEAICAKFPDLVDRLPKIYLFTNGDGEKIYGTMTEDIDRYFPKSSESWSPGNKQRRKDLKQQMEQARDERDAARKKHGIKKALHESYLSRYKANQSFIAICRFIPSSAAEARTQARLVRSFLPQFARDIDGGHHRIYGQSKSLADYDAWKDARADAFDYLSILLLALTKVRAS